MSIPGDYDQSDGELSLVQGVDATMDSERAAPSPGELAHDLAHLANIVGNVAHLLDLHAADPAAVRRHAASLAEIATRGAALADRLASRGLPARATLPTSGDAAPADSPAAGSLRVLVVEDDAVGRDLLGTILRTAGHTVVTAAGLHEAMRTLDASGDDLDVLITDVGLDDGSGWELVTIARQRLPLLRIGVVTGWRDVAHEPNATGADFVVGKPFRLDELLAHLNA